MLYHLACTEDNAEVRKAVDEAQGVFDMQGKREWVEWAGKTLMPCMHAQMAMERADEMRLEQEALEDALEEMRRQDESEQQERERVEKEVELEEKEAEYIRQLNEKVIDAEK
jgi:hypothetical protein